MDPRERRLSEIMQKEVATLTSDERLDLADDVMALGRVRHMPVVEGTRVVGVVSQRDVMAAGLTRVLEFEPEQRRTFMRSVQVSEVMAREPVTLGPDATLAEAAEQMVKHRIGCVPVVKPDKTLLGLVTETDLLRAAFLGVAGSDETELEVESVSEFSEKVQEDMDALRRARDELRVQIHLGAAEAKDLWDSMESKWRELESKAKHVVREAEEPLQEIGEAAKQLVEEIRDGYRKIKDSL